MAGDTFILDLLYTMAASGGQFKRDGQPRTTQKGYTFGASSFHGHRRLNTKVQFMQALNKFEKDFPDTNFAGFTSAALFGFLEQQKVMPQFGSEDERAKAQQVIEPMLAEIIKSKQNSTRDVSASDQIIVQDVMNTLAELAKKYEKCVENDFSTREVQDFYTEALKAVEPLAELNSPFYAQYMSAIQEGIQDMKNEMDTNLATTAHGEAKEASKAQRKLKIGAAVSVTIGILAFAACWALPPLGAAVTFGLLAVGSVSFVSGLMVSALTMMLGKSDAQQAASVATKAGIVPKDEAVSKENIITTVTNLTGKLKKINDEAAKPAKEQDHRL